MPPLLLGHRGARRSAPENTLAAFRIALEQGCDGFELDLRRTADAQCVLCHDKHLARREVEKSSYSELLQAYRKRRPDCCDEDSPTLLERVLARFSGAYIDIEIKVAGVEEDVAAAVRMHPPQAYCVSSFLPEVLLRYRALEPAAPLGLIAQTTKRLAAWRELPVQAVFAYRTLVTSELIREVHRTGRQLLVWTVNEPREMLRFAEWGADGIISDRTELLVRTLDPGRRTAGLAGAR